MSLFKQLSGLVQVLESYRGKDRIIRMLTYVAMYMGDEGKTSAQMKWKTISAEMGACRVILRLFDDLPMLLFNVVNSFGLKEKPGILRPLGLLTALLNQSFYPSEHIAWLRQKKILPGLPGPMLLLGLSIWALSLFVEIIRSLIKLKIFSVQASKLKKQTELDKDGPENSPQNTQIKENLAKLAAERREVTLLLIQSAADLLNAVSWFPQPGFLWSQKLTPRINGVLGMVSSGLLLYRNWPSTKSL